MFYIIRHLISSFAEHAVHKISKNHRRNSLSIAYNFTARFYRWPIHCKICTVQLYSFNSSWAAYKYVPSLWKCYWYTNSLYVELKTEFFWINHFIELFSLSLSAWAYYNGSIHPSIASLSNNFSNFVHLLQFWQWAYSKGTFVELSKEFSRSAWDFC